VRRRSVVAAIVTAAAFQPFAGTAQQAGRIYRLGLWYSSPAQSTVICLDELRRLGFVEGDNLDVDARGFALTVERLELVAMVVSAGSPTPFSRAAMPQPARRNGQRPQFRLSPSPTT
jgi:hypothetical protein